ncbi:MAG TPA: AAA family ATPase, partial [Deltaproteobacteria bacterium]|nr:AAA family ATPase [Deltaproteobacteria bacterium]
MDGYKKIPYGISSYKTIKQENYYYVDKTRYLSQLEETGTFLFLIRPRRFGKSSLLTVLECYYDMARKEEFDFLFQGTHIADHPTPEKNSHLILKFNFSQVNPDPDKVEASFHAHARNCFFFFEKKYREFLEDDYFKMMKSHQETHEKLEFLLSYVGSRGLKVYVLIDEYDNFTNTILATSGQEKYHELTHGAGFLRFFFNVLKGAADQADAGISRMFITGVSPVTMDDVTSGFNIGRNISLHPAFNELLGFTEQNVIEILEYYRDTGMVVPDADGTLNLMRDWYDGYRFSPEAVMTLFNTDMVFYFVQNLLELKKYPKNLIDQNVKIDYGKLRHLVIINRRLNGNFSRLEEIMETGGVMSDIVESFPVED